MCTTFVSRKSISFHFSPLSTTCYVYFSTCPSKWQGLNRKKIRKLRHRFFFRTHVSEFSVLIYICFYFHSYFTAPSPALFQSPSPTRYTDLRVCQAPHCSDKLCHMLPLCQYFDSAAVLHVQSFELILHPMHSPFLFSSATPPYFTVILRLPPAKSKLFRPIKFDKKRRFGSKSAYP